MSDREQTRRDGLSQTTSPVTYLGMTTTHITRLQDDVLGIVRECGPVTASDIAYHLPIGVQSARGVLTRLEKKKCIEATYTGHHRGVGRAYIAAWDSE